MATYSDLLSILEGKMEREQGKDARMNNIAEALETGRLVETSFGPKGLKKMIDGVVVEKGSRILGAAAPKHPVQKMIVDMAKDVEKEIGDATTTSVILTTYLLEEARDLDVKEDANYGWIEDLPDREHLILHIMGIPHDH